VSLDLLFRPVEEVDAWLSGMLNGSSLPVALSIAFVLGLRHASDPDHLVAVTSLVAAERGDARSAARLGAWWGIGHAGVLLGVGLPLILLKARFPAGVESAAEKAVGLVILVLAARVIAKWVRGDYRVTAHAHRRAETDAVHGLARHLRRGSGAEHPHRHVRTPRQALAIGALHGVAGTGTVVLLLVAGLPTQVEAAAALAVFAPMSIFSMALCTTAFAWILTRPMIEPVYRSVLIPALGLFGVLFGLSYAGLS
jgi:hypothetical protein